MCERFANGNSMSGENDLSTANSLNHYFFSLCLSASLGIPGWNEAVMMPQLCHTSCQGDEGGCVWLPVNHIWGPSKVTTNLDSEIFFLKSLRCH